MAPPACSGHTGTPLRGRPCGGFDGVTEAVGLLLGVDVGVAGWLWVPVCVWVGVTVAVAEAVPVTDLVPV